MMMRIKVIVLSYNGVNDTLACLESLQQQAEGVFEILVVDNASTDGAPATIRAQFPQIPLIELTENLGWAGGNNVGIKHAIDDGAEFVCLLNNDTIIPRGAIAELARAADRYKPCLMHPAIDYANPEEGSQIDPSRDIPAKKYTPLEQDEATYELQFAYGACLMIPVEVFHRIGAFDERFFLQLEETDFWLRARKAGMRSLCTVRARITHAESRSFGGRMTPAKVYYMARNTLLLAEKHRRTPAAALQTLRELYWMAASTTSGKTPGSQKVPRLKWAISRDPFLMAMRAGLRDYLLRHFGRMGASTFRSITR
jgi:GT2 family glycosyltransferase